MKPTRGYNSPRCHSTLATTRRFVLHDPALIAEAGIIAPHMVRRTTDGACQEVGNAFLKNLVGFEADGILEILDFHEPAFPK